MVTYLHVLFFLLGLPFGWALATLILSKLKKRRFENIGPDRTPDVKIAAEIMGYSVQKDYINMSIKVDDRVIHAVVPHEVMRLFPPNSDIYLVMKKK